MLEESGNFLDLGAFRGLIPIVAGALFNLNAYGIEVRPGAVSLANKAIEGMKTEGYFSRTSCKVYLGNFFPQDEEISEKVKWAGSEKIIPEFVKSANPYKQMGLDLDKFDTIFFYQFTNNISPILRMLSERCKPESLILIPHELDFVDVPSNLKLVNNQQMSIYRKK